MNVNLTSLWLKKMGSHRGAPRLWFDSDRVCSAGLIPGVRFDLVQLKNGIKLVPAAAGAYTVSSKLKHGKTVPVIDINSKEALNGLSEEPVVRVIIRSDGVYVLPLASEVAKRERLTRLKTKLADGQPLLVASLAHGGGVLAHAAHTGLAAAGIPATLAVCNEIDESYLEQSLAHNPVASPRTVALCAPMQEVIQDEWLMQQLPKVDVLEVGIPCSGHSNPGRSKRGLKLPEDHPEVGHLVHAALALIGKLQPASVVVENVPAYGEHASASILRSQLRDMGYQVTEHVLSARDFGCLENRVRWALVATTDGIPTAPLQAIQRDPLGAPERLGELLDEVPLDDESWRPLNYLKVKQDRDLAAGKGFAMQVVNPDSTQVPVIRRGYAKGGSTDPFIQHPQKPELLRKFTPGEHARIKGVPEELIDGLSATTAHQMLGQGIAYAPFRQLFECLGIALRSLLHDGPCWTMSSSGAKRIEATTG